VTDQRIAERFQHQTTFGGPDAPAHEVGNLVLVDSEAFDRRHGA
jgi:hypothetical protein